MIRSIRHFEWVALAVLSFAPISCTGLLGSPDEVRKADPVSASAEDYDAAVRSTAQRGKAGDRKQPPGTTPVHSDPGTTTRPAKAVWADDGVGPAGLVPKPLELAGPVWSRGPGQPTATIPYYIRGEHTSTGYTPGSYQRQSNYTRGEWTSAGYVPGNYRGESDNYIRGEWTSAGYVRGNYRSELMFPQPATLTTLPPSGSQSPAYHYP